MKITMYELLGLVKDSKSPKKIKYGNVKLTYNEGCEDYYLYYGEGLFEYKFGNCKNFLNDEVEIIEENKKFFKKLPNDYTGTIEVENGYIVEKEILDEEEKEYLSAIIRPFRDRVNYIAKKGVRKEYIQIVLKKDNECFFLPYFEKDTMYKGMEADKKYTLKELGLDE